MPQLIAMIIIVVGAMIYMFQTFGGTGDKIEGVAQKTSIVTEINNVKNGLQLAMRGSDITAANPNTLAGLAGLAYFADQMNLEIGNNAVAAAYTAVGDLNTQINTYSAISFGGETNPALFLSYIPVANAGDRPAIRVQFAQNGTLWTNRAFLEAQLANDLQAIAAIDRTTVNGNRVAIVDNEVPAANRPATINVENNPANNAAGAAADAALLGDGVFTIYFKDLPGVTAN